MSTDTEYDNDLAAARDARDLLERQLSEARELVDALNSDLARLRLDHSTVIAERDAARSKYEAQLTQYVECADDLRATQDKLILANAKTVRLANELELVKLDHQRRLDDLVAAAHAEADDRDWCDDFDDWMEEHGLPRRAITRQFFHDVVFRYRGVLIRIYGLAVEDTGDDEREAALRARSTERLTEVLVETFGFDPDGLTEVGLQ